MTSIVKVIFLEERHSKFLLESEMILFTPMEDHKNIVENIFVSFFFFFNVIFYFLGDQLNICEKFTCSLFINNV